jgi:hypothetical protein
VTEDASLQPELAVVLQEEPEDNPKIEVCVRDVHGPVRTQALPRKAATAFSKTIAAAAVQPAMILRADHYRGQATLISSVAIRVSFNDPGESYAVWPANVPLVISAAVDTYVRGDAGAATVSVIVEKWATGE